MQGRKSNQKSRNSTAKKSQTNKKPINHKDKITNAIKKSILITSNTNKIRNSSKSKHIQTQKKIPKNPYQIDSHRHRPVKAVSNVSKSMPVRNQKPKTMQFPFEAIKFKQKPNNDVIKSKTQNGFYIQYDEPEQLQIDMSVLNNSKKILGSYNQRVSRYNQLKSKPKIQFSNQINNGQFKQALIKLFKFLDPHCNMVVSHDQIDYRKLPQGVLYFLGGLFHKIRQRNLFLSQHQFLEQCTLLYKRSSNQDVKWFIEEVFTLTQDIKTNSLKKKIISNGEFGIINQDCFKKIKVEQKQCISTNNLASLVSGYNNLSFDHQENVISFRDQTKQNQYNTKDSNPSEKESVKSPHFGQFQHRFSFNNNNKIQLQINIPQQNHNISKNTQNFHNQKSLRNSLSQLQQKQVSTIRTIGIKKNITDKAEDLRQQIYAKMDKMKLCLQNKQNFLLKQNFISKSKPQQHITSHLISNELSQNKIHSNISKTLTIKDNKIIDSFIPKDKKQFPKDKSIHSQLKDEKFSSFQQSFNRQPLMQKNTGWVNNVTNCKKAFNQLQKMKQDFKIQKKIIEKRQISRQNYIKQNSQKTNPLIQDFILEDETRVLKLTQKRQIFEKSLEKQSSKYERNIDRLSILSHSRNQNLKTININQSLANSCRKSLQISIPLRYEGQRIMSLSEKRTMGHQKVDKIEQLSQKIEKYLKNNAQKIQYSKNFTQTPITVGYNKILAM